ncbi:MAG: hypothetical protein M3Q48_08410 [Actinomycetota bacterium]|nr:hypothetical protein [Actinomycetota bacterium]
MAEKRRRALRRGSQAATTAPPVGGRGAGGGGGVLEEIHALVDAPLADLVGTAEERAEVEELSRQAVAVPAMARLRQVVAFVGTGCPATQAGNLKAADALALARRLGPAGDVPEKVRSMEELPNAAHAFRWAAAAEFLAWRGTKIVGGPLASDLESDPLAAWFTATLTLVEHGVLDGFRQGWRKSYVELLDGAAAGLVVSLAEAGGRAPIAAVDEGAWEQVAAAYGYEPDDDAERAHVVKLVRAMVRQFGDAGVMRQVDDEVVLTDLGFALAAVVTLASADDDEDDLDLVDTDAQSLLLVCVEEMELADAGPRLRGWCAARPADQAVNELCEAMMEEHDPDVWDLGFQALEMIAIRPSPSPPSAGFGRIPACAPWPRRGWQTTARRPPAGPG